MTRFDYDLLVVGAGSGGVRAARASAAYGARVAVAEEFRVGGTCVIRGCVPKKVLFYGALFAEQLGAAARFGWNVGQPTFDWLTLRGTVLEEVDRLERLYSANLARAGVDVFKQRATLTGPHGIRLADGREISARKILIATGAHPVRPAVPGVELGITSNEMFHLGALPRRLVVVGAGYIANEMAGTFQALGSKVTIVTRGDAILRGYDVQIRDRLVEISKAKGIEFRFRAPLQSITKSADGTLRVAIGGGGRDAANPEILDADVVLLATGRVPNVAGLGLADVGVALADDGAIQVDADSKTTVDSIYAVGDVTGRIPLTPVAIREGQAFASTVFGNVPTRVDYEHIPTGVFSQPPIAAVGLTEAQARAVLGDVRTYTSDFRPLSNVVAGRDQRALYKMVVDAATDVVVGLHMIGPDAPEILQAAAVAVKAGLTKADFDATIALHPSMAEELVLLK